MDLLKFIVLRRRKSWIIIFLIIFVVICFILMNSDFVDRDRKWLMNNDEIIVLYI